MAWMRIASAVVSGIALVCWMLMFLAGHDVWHDTGRPDIWALPGPPYADLRVFVVTYYVLGAALVADAALTAVRLVRSRPDRA